MERRGDIGIVRTAWLTAIAMAALLALGSVALASPRHRHVRPRHSSHHRGDSAEAARTATPIKHIVVVFQENRSFDRYFGIIRMR